MCGRLTMTHPTDAMARLFEAVPSNDLPDGPRYNVCPTQTLAVVTADAGTRRLRPMRWGFLPVWYKTPRDGPLLINARAETIAEKNAFRAAVRDRRCLIPATGFYEWTKDADGNRLPWYFEPADGSVLVFAGIWQDWERDGESYTTCAIVTTGAGERMSEIHHREPVRIAPDDWALWLGEGEGKAAPLMKAAPDEYYRRHRVDPKVNSNRAEGPELVEPL
ncbi:SOS response-associated peptidase [Rhodobacterales bacterium HKCCE3408]|nr:SOS response-associated peptidase [Rhodobacterales bacterium HKCCE3408]